MRTLNNFVAATALMFGAALVGSPAAYAQKGEPAPQPKCDRFKKGSPEWKRCTGTSRDDLSQDQLFYAGYWLARTGQYAEALSYLEKARSDDPRVLTYIGFAQRKLGKTDLAMGYYQRALALDANYTVARAYMGEAFIAQGRLAEAKVELAEIKTRCGVTCSEYGELEAALKGVDAL